MLTLSGTLPCASFPVRGGEKSAFESSAAELYMQTAYMWSFRERYSNPSLALPLAAGPRFFGSSYFSYLLETTDSSLSMPIQVCLKYLLSDFRNPLPQTRVKALEQAYKNNKLTWELIRDFRDLITRPGGMRKPDILGIVAEGEPGTFDLHEVCTVGTVDETKKESAGKLDQLRKQVIPLVETELASRQSELRRSGSPLVHSVIASPSAWAPTRNVRACPLGVTFDAQRNAVKVKWACFEPAIDLVSDVFGGRPQLVTPGVLPYHIHELEGPPLNAVLPASVRSDLKKWEGELARSRGLGPLELLPEANPAIRKELATWTPDGRRFLAYATLGVATLLLIIVAAPLVADLLVGAAALDLGSIAVGSAVVRMRALVPTMQALYALTSDYAVSLSRAAASAH